jgi:hypothetical protein
MAEEICPDYWLRHIGNDKLPQKFSPETKGKRKSD